MGFTMCKMYYFNKIFTSTKSAICEILVYEKPFPNTPNPATPYQQHSDMCQNWSEIKLFATILRCENVGKFYMEQNIFKMDNLYDKSMQIVIFSYSAERTKSTSHQPTFCTDLDALIEILE
jgi:hypothetical protein